MSFVWGEENVSFVRKRYEALTANPLFSEMKFAVDKTSLNEWMRLVFKGRTLTNLMLQPAWTG